VKVWKGKK